MGVDLSAGVSPETLPPGGAASGAAEPPVEAAVALEEPVVSQRPALSATPNGSFFGSPQPGPAPTYIGNPDTMAASGEMWTQDDFDLIEANMIHAVPGLGSDRSKLRDMSTKFLAAADQELLDVFFADAEAALALTTDDYLKAYVLASFERGGPSLSTAAILSATQQYEARFGTFRSAASMLAAREGMSREFKAGSVTFADAKRAAGKGVVLPTSAQDFAHAVEAGTARDGVFTTSGRDLAFAWTDDTGTFESKILLEPGTVIESAADALAAYALADAGLKHELVEGDLPGRKNAAGRLLSALGDTVRWVENHSPETMQASQRALDQVWGQGVAFAEGGYGGMGRLAATGEGPVPKPVVLSDEERASRIAAEVTDRTALIAVAADEMEKAGVVGDGRDLILAAGEHVDGVLAENPGLQEEMAAKTKEDLIRQFAQETDDAGVVLPWLQETVLDDSVTMLETYDKHVHDLGLGVIGGVEGLTAVLEGDGYEGFKAAFEEQVHHDYVSEAFGIDPHSAYGTWMNTAASFLLDPVTWLTAGGASSWKLFDELLTNPEMAGKFVEQTHVQSAIRHMVVGTDRRVSWAMLQDGMFEDDFLRLWEITGTEYAGDVAKKEAWQEVTDIMVRNLPSSGGAWNPAGPRTITHVKNATGVSEMFRRMPGLSKEQQEHVAGLVARASRDRSGSMGDNFLQQALDHAIWAFDGDMDAVGEAFASAVKSAKATKAASSVEKAAVAQKIQSLTSLRRANRARLAGGDVGATGGYRRFLTDLDSQVEKAAAAGRDDIVTQLNSLAENARVHVALFEDEYDSLIAQGKQLKQRLEGAQHELNLLRAPRDRGPIEQWWQEFYRSWGERLGLEETAEPHPFLRDDKGKPLNKLDWSPIVGEKDAGEWTETNVRNVLGWVGDKDQSSAARALSDRIEHLDGVIADANGMLDDAASLSVAEQKKYSAIARNASRTRKRLAADLDTLSSTYAGTASAELSAAGIGAQRGMTLLPASPLELLAYDKMGKYFEKILPQRVKANLSATLDSVQSVFATTVLLNLNTPVKTHLDEIIRFAQDVGFNRNTLARANGIGRDVAGGRPALYQREAASPVAHRMRPWKRVDPSKRGQWKAAERWVNGSLVRDSSFAAYARAVEFDEPEARRLFGEWWDAEGHQLARRTSLGGAPIDADRAFDAIRNGFDLMLEDTTGGEWWKTRLLAAAREGRQIEDLKPSQWKKFAHVPGQAEPAMRKTPVGVLDKSFDLLYGKPSARRGGVIYEHYYDWKRDMLSRAWKGRVIDEDLLVRHGFAADKYEAREILALGERSTTIRDMKATGYRLQSDIDAAAASYAKTTADSMMYQMATVSVMGKKLSRVYPWGRAQTDYLGYWFKKLLEPTTFQAQLGTKGVGPAKTINTGVNLRLADRIGHVALMGNPDGQSDPYSPGYFVDTWTFMPSTLDDSFLMENTVSPGPIASWLVNWLSPDHPLRNAFEELHPQHRIFNDYQNHGADSLTNMVDAIVPASPRSLRRLVGTEMSTALDKLGIDTAAFYRFMTTETEPPFYRPQLALSMGNWLEDGNFWQDVSAGTGQGTPWGDNMDRIATEATHNAYGRESMELLRKQVGMPSVFADEIQYAKFYLPIEGYLKDWVAAGFVSPGLAENYEANLEGVRSVLEAEAGVQTSEDRKARREFLDAAVDIFYALPDLDRNDFIVNHPGVAVNLVSWSEVTGRVPDEWADAVEGGRIVVNGSKRIDAFRAGREGGWVTQRETGDVQADVANRLNRAASNYLAGVFQAVTGSTWGRQTMREGTPTRFGQGTITLSPEQVAYLEGTLDKLGVDIPAEWEQHNGGWVTSAASFKAVLDAAKSQFKPKFEIDGSIDAALSKTPDGRLLVDATKSAEKRTTDLGVDKPLDWINVDDPDGEIQWVTGSAADDLEAYRAEFRRQIATNPNFTEAMYNGSYAYYYGPLDYEPPSPPPVAELDVSVSGPPAEFRVVDGDTIAFEAADGKDVRFRLMGINAPDDAPGQVGYAEATANLRRFLSEHENVTLGSFDAERYGTTQRFKSFVDGKVVEDERVFAWLYVDGVPVWNPAEFSADNERGMPTSVAVPEYAAWWSRESDIGEVG